MAKKVTILSFFLFLMLGLVIGCNENDDSPVGPSNSAAGTWVHDDGLEYKFNSNGTITGSAIDALNVVLVAFSAPAQSWTYSDTHILVDGQQATTYTVEDNKLTFKNENGENVTLIKK